MVATLSDTKAVRAFKIFYSEETRLRIDAGFIPLDNSNPLTPGWFEIEPILAALRQIDWSDFKIMGVFSPRFIEKTGLSYSNLCDFISEDGAESDVYIFSPQPDMGAFFLNVFEQGETFDPGFKTLGHAVFSELGVMADLDSLVMDSRRIVFSNYFAAKKQFWGRWRELVEGLVALSESSSELGQQLRRKTSYPGGVQVKVFLAERIASLILATEPQWKVRAYNPFGFAWSATRFRENPNVAYIHDALKIAYRDTGRQEYMDAFAYMRQRFIDRKTD